MITRCSWANNSLIEQEYHDQQWGKPTYDDPLLFELLILEMMQAGLSWQTILKKRESMRTHFDGYNVHKIAAYDQSKLEQLMTEPSIIRNQNKLKAMINNAKMFIRVQKEFKSFSNYLWQFSDYTIVDNQPLKPEHIPTQSPLSERIVQDMKQRGFKFIGPTMIYSYLEAVGVINNHLMSCFVRKK